VDPESNNSSAAPEGRVKDVAGVILAGGRSSRYGRNKALVELDHVPLIERVVRVMTSIFHKVVLITNTPDEYDYLNFPMFSDIIKGLGPLGGIYTGLKVLSNPFAFFVACDMPFLNPFLIRHMVSVKNGFDVVVPRISGKIEALHGLYSRRCLSNIESQLESGTYQIRRWDPDFRSFLNINTPEQLRMLGGHEPAEGITQRDGTIP
jgi:molybdopterin-guanine dinucleotide biosynthesis protein A